MSSDEKPPMPPQPTTKEIPRVMVPGNTLEAVLYEVRAMRTETGDRLDRIEATVDTVVEDGKAANMRMTRLEVRMDSFDDRGSKFSGGIRQLSDTDAKHENQLSSISARVNVVEGKVDAVDAKVDTGFKEVRSELALNSQWTKELVDKLIDTGKSFFKTHPEIAKAIIAFITTVLTVLTTLLAAWATRGH
jgi:hypothetical protein